MERDVPVTFLVDLLCRELRTDEEDVRSMLRIPLQRLGYPADACRMTTQDALALLELTDSGFVGPRARVRDVHPAPAGGTVAEVPSAQADIAAAMERRVVIGEAKGILMERFDLDRDEAFALLSRRSQERNVKLHDLAHELVRTRQVP